MAPAQPPVADPDGRGATGRPGGATATVGTTPSQRAHNRHQEHTCCCEVLGRTGNLQTALGLFQDRFFPETAPQAFLVVQKDASPLVKREIQHETYALYPSRKRKTWRSIDGSASRRYMWREARFLSSETEKRKGLASDELSEPVQGGRSAACTEIPLLQTEERAYKRFKTGKNRRAFDNGSGPAAPRVGVGPVPVVDHGGGATAQPPPHAEIVKATLHWRICDTTVASCQEILF